MASDQRDHGLSDNKRIDRRQFLRGLALAGLAAGVAGCTGTPAAAPPAPTTAAAKPAEAPKPGAAASSEVLIAAVLPMTGGVAFEGGQALKGLQLAVEDVNAAGGIKSMGGAKLKLVSRDHQAKPEVAIAETEKLVGEGVKGVFGTMVSGVAMVMGPVLEKAQVPFIMHAASMEALTQQGWKYSFRTQPDVSQFARNSIDALAGLAKSAGVDIKKVAVIADNTPAYATATELLKTYIPSKGYTVTDALLFKTANADFTPEVTKLKASGPDVVIVISYLQDALQIVKTMQQLQFNAKAYVGVANGGFSNPTFPNQAGKLSLGLMDSNYWYNPKHPKIEGIRANAKKMFNEDFSSHMAQAYVGIQVYVGALEAAGSSEGAKVRDALAKLELKDHILPAGPLKFDANGQNTESGAVVLQRFDKDMKVVLPEQYAEAKPVFPIAEWDKRQ